MKKFIKILVCVCLCIVTFSFVGCGKDKKIERPASNAIVVSNGGLVVKKGNFLYYANGYSSVENVKKSNLNKKYTIGGLYMSKTNENGSISRDENGSAMQQTRMSAELTGFEATDLHIYGNYIYYTTINTEENKNGETQEKHLEIHRKNLNGTEHKRVYRSGIDFISSQESERVVNFEYFVCGENVYILIIENKTLKSICCTPSSIGSVKTIKTDVLSYVVSDDETDCDKIFYMTKNEDDIYEITNYDISKNKEVYKSSCSSGDVIDSLFAVKFDRLYYYAKYQDRSASYLYSVELEDLETAQCLSEANSNQLTYTSYTSLYLLDNYIDGILVISSSKVEIINQMNPSEIVLQENMPTSSTIMLVNGGYVYYFENSDIYRWNYTNDTKELICSEENTICNYAYDIDNYYLYYFATKGENDYLFRVGFADRSPENLPELVGVYQESDLPKDEE